MSGRFRHLVALSVTSLLLLFLPETSWESPSRVSTRRAHILYYGWYGTPEHDGAYYHWDQNDRIPPDDIASGFFPKLGIYSSRDPAVIEQHMKWIAASGVGVLTYAWQGDGDPSRDALELVMDAAWAHGLQVSFLIDQNPPRAPKELMADIETITSQFGTHPAFYRISRPTRFGPSVEPRGVFYIFDPFLKDTIDPAEWAPVVDATRGTFYDAIIIGQAFDMPSIERAHFDGLFTFDVLKTDAKMFHTFKEQARRSNLIFVPTVGPGYDDRRAVPHPAGHVSREAGTFYDRFWDEVIRIQPEWVTINSFNEWHEGSQIEPASVRSNALATYDDFEGAYGHTGGRAQTAYLERTSFWIANFIGPLARR